MAMRREEALVEGRSGHQEKAIKLFCEFDFWKRPCRFRPIRYSKNIFFTVKIACGNVSI